MVVVVAVGVGAAAAAAAAAAGPAAVGPHDANYSDHGVESADGFERSAAAAIAASWSYS